jgi:hypothetical protein
MSDRNVIELEYRTATETVALVFHNVGSLRDAGALLWVYFQCLVGSGARGVHESRETYRVRIERECRDDGSVFWHAVHDCGSKTVLAAIVLAGAAAFRNSDDNGSGNNNNN